MGGSPSYPQNYWAYFPNSNGVWLPCQSCRRKLNFIDLRVTDDVISQFKLKKSTFGTCSHVVGWWPLASSELTQFRSSYSQLHTEGTTRVLTLYLVHFKVKARSQNVTIIFKSQIDHATHVSWSFLTTEFDLCVHWVVGSYFKLLIVKVRSWSGQNWSTFQFHKFQQKCTYLSDAV